MICLEEKFNKITGCEDSTIYSPKVFYITRDDAYLYEYSTYGDNATTTKFDTPIKLKKYDVENWVDYSYTYNNVKYIVDIRELEDVSTKLNEELCSKYQLACGRW